MNLVDKYRPRTLADIVGQPWIVEQLQSFVESPVSTALLFEGDTGTGKTSTALALAHDLGIDIANGPLGGLHQIASGEQTGETVRRIMNGLRLFTLSGSGWKMLIVNEADCMTPNAAYIWLDALENLPPRTVIVFTTNHADRLPARLRDRCETFSFEAGYLALAPYLPELIAKVWKSETGRDDPPALDELGAIQDEKGNVSVRRVLQMLVPLLRTRMGPNAKVPCQAPKTKRAVAARIRKELQGDEPSIDEHDLHILGKRWQAGEKITTLAKLVPSLSWNRLWGQLTKLGYHPAKQGA